MCGKDGPNHLECEHLTGLHAMRNGGSILLERIVSIVPLLSAKFEASLHYGKKSLRIAVAPSL